LTNSPPISFRPLLRQRCPAVLLALGTTCTDRSAVAQDATPLPRIAGQFTYFISGSWHEANGAEVSMAWVDHSWTAMKRHSSKGTYINYLSTNDAAAVKASYGQNLARLAELKRKYDPVNFSATIKTYCTSAPAAIRKHKS
jgi:hypothetical protein